MADSITQNSNIFSNIKQDLPASIVVFFVALPLCLGIALASGAPLFSGLIAGIIGGIVVASISNSSLGVSGPAAGLAIIVLTSIQSLGGYESFLVAVVLAGIIQIILGFLKGGVIGYYFPSSVIKGMLASIGIIIFLKQIPHALGYDADYEGDLDFQQTDGENTFSELITMVDYISPGAVIISVMSLIILLGWDNYLSKKHNFFKTIQGSLVAVAAGIGFQAMATKYFPEYAVEEQHLVSVPVSVDFSSFLGQFTFPDFSRILDSDIWMVAVTVAVVASLETLLSVEATDKLDPKKRITNTNRELLAQGTGNILSGLIGGLPITQVIVRSSANIQSGGQTKLSAILHGFFLLICVAFIPFVLNMIPLASLACVLFIVGYKLAKPSLFKKMYDLGWRQFLPFLVTILGVVFTDLLKGIAMGVVVAVIILLKNSIKNSHFLHAKTTDNGEHKVKMTLAEDVSFLNKGSILKELNNLPNGTHLIVDMSNSFSIDYDVLEIIDNYKKTAKNKGVTVDLINRGEKPTVDY
jgi:MFS superfamily sulfate permease-like transporter